MNNRKGSTNCDGNNDPGTSKGGPACDESIKKEKKQRSWTFVVFFVLLLFGVTALAVPSFLVVMNQTSKANSSSSSSSQNQANATLGEEGKPSASFLLRATEVSKVTTDLTTSPNTTTIARPTPPPTTMTVTTSADKDLDKGSQKAPQSPATQPQSQQSHQAPVSIGSNGEQLVAISSELNVSIAAPTAPGSNIEGCRLIFIMTNETMVRSSHLELEVTVTVGAIFQTSAVLDSAGRAAMTLPTELLLTKEDSMKVTLTATLGMTIDTSTAIHWPNHVTNTTDAPKPVHLVANHSISLSSVRQQMAGNMVAQNSQQDSSTKGTSNSNSTCGYIHGREAAQGWWSTKKGQDTWLPEGTQGCQFLPPKRGIRILLLGDSQCRTMFQVMMRNICSDWTAFNFPSPSSGIQSKTWCLPMRVPPPSLKHRKDWDMRICNGKLDVWGDGCNWGGATWYGDDGSTMLYADHHGVTDARYRDWNFVTNSSSNTVKLNEYDVVITGSELHDMSQPLGDEFNSKPENTPYGKKLLKHLKGIREWHTGPVICLGAWATSPAQRRKGFWWAASLTKVVQYSHVAQSVIAKYPDVWHLEMIRPSLLYRDQSKDGVHLYYPKPMTQFAQIIWHNVAIVTKGKSNSGTAQHISSPSRESNRPSSYNAAKVESTATVKSQASPPSSVVARSENAISKSEYIIDIAPSLSVLVDPMIKTHYLLTFIAKSNLDLSLELEVVMRIGSVFHTAAVLRSNRAEMVVPSDLLPCNASITLTATLGTAIDASTIHLWPNDVTANVTVPNPVHLVSNHTIRLEKSPQQQSSSKLEASGTANISKNCEFINGQELAQGWWSKHNMWLPEGPSGCKFLPPKRGVRILLLGDSQCRTMFQAMMKNSCSDWTSFDYPAPGLRGNTWCRPMKEPDPSLKQRKEWDKYICNGKLDVWGDGCNWGGATWYGADGSSLVYADHHGVTDARYRDWKFLTNSSNDDKPKLNEYDVVVTASELHDLNQPLGDQFEANPKQTPYGKKLVKHLEGIRQWHSGPVICLGAWATLPSQRKNGFWWAASLTKVIQYSHVAQQVIAQFPDISHVEMLRPSLLYRDQSNDGVHLYHPKPMTQFAQIIWHNIAIVTGTVSGDNVGISSIR